MYEIIFYTDKKGKASVFEFITSLSTKKGKDARINLNAIQEYIERLKNYGTRIGKPTVKYLGDDIWELRPLRNRILFATLIDNKFILLHHFLKQTQKTPQREIEKAKNNLADYKARRLQNGKK